jgi:hypothetical protein
MVTVDLVEWVQACRNIIPIPVQTTEPLLSDASHFRASRLQQFLLSPYFIISTKSTSLCIIQCLHGLNCVHQREVPECTNYLPPGHTSSVDSRVSYFQVGSCRPFFISLSTIHNLCNSIIRLATLSTVDQDSESRHLTVRFCSTGYPMIVVSPQRNRRSRYVLLVFVILLAPLWNIYSSPTIFAGQTNLSFLPKDALSLPVLGLDMNISSPNAPQEPLLQPPDSFSACLLIMDENFRLYDWLSYHYHVLPLRYAVIAVDPRSELFPDSILDVFRKELNMTIVRWTDSDFADWGPLPANATSTTLTRRYLFRQSLFLEGCMEHLNQHNRTWTALWDADEYIVFQGYGRKNKQNETIVSPPNLTEPGTILKYIQQTETKTCVPMNRVEVGTKEDSMLQNRSFSSTHFAWTLCAIDIETNLVARVSETIPERYFSMCNKWTFP